MSKRRPTRPLVPPLAAGLVAASALLPALAGCGGSGAPVEPGPDGGSPACAQLTGRLPGTVLDRPRQQLAVAGAAAWGEPAIVLRCGVAPAGPTDDPCLAVDGVDWVFTEDDDGFRFRSFGRTPAVEVTFPLAIGRTAAPAGLVDLASAVEPLPVSARCEA